ncbi:MAG: 30S ribosome-binding factor RbfA [Gemmatimonadales bacterium]|nr:30S ribosome-binding factor RbfA [Gemmatimonadota bacterium]MBP6668681.1 30S ribosome-binding factor RbfA [Gemmatimonadales bacterium]MBK7348791.1 30S ribosome-binding factor RbfA [Gemmatimonadota bacterium]MBK7783420.1 30S ribosome-binding factor RbfA [Gemmatimonadota bacterium]MBK9068531.1 30S ribosome-binding factor RbfA [Gemmatimonadota bacterium]
MRGPKRRPDQVGETIRQVVADALLTELRDPRIGFVTVTEVRVTNDLAVATIRVSIMGEDAERDAALEGLGSAAGYLRKLVAQALSVRIVPELRFELDRGQEHSARINQILSELREERGD